jgi:hypothetical protein
LDTTLGGGWGRISAKDTAVEGTANLLCYGNSPLIKSARCIAPSGQTVSRRWLNIASLLQLLQYPAGNPGIVAIWSVVFHHGDEFLTFFSRFNYFPAQNSAAKLIVFIGPCERLVQEWTETSATGFGVEVLSEFAPPSPNIFY